MIAVFIAYLRHFCPFTVSAACYAAGYLVGVAAFVWFAKRRNLATSGVLILMAVGLVGGLLFANICQLVFAHETGKTILGGVVGGYLCVALAKKRMGIVRPLGDLFAVAVSAGEMVGRFGCFFGGCCGGKPSHVPWAVYQDHAWRHPTQLYLSGASACILVTLLIFDKKRPPENTLFYLQGTLMCACRFVIEFFREGTPVALGITTAQIACLVGAPFFGWKLSRLHRRTMSKTVPTFTPSQLTFDGIERTKTARLSQ